MHFASSLRVLNLGPNEFTAVDDSLCVSIAVIQILRGSQSESRPNNACSVQHVLYRCIVHMHTLLDACDGTNAQFIPGPLEVVDVNAIPLTRAMSYLMRNANHTSDSCARTTL